MKKTSRRSERVADLARAESSRLVLIEAHDPVLRKVTITDGPFMETKEMLGGYNIIEAPNLDEAVRIASKFPWTETGCVEIRPIRDIAAVRLRVGAGEQPA